MDREFASAWSTTAPSHNLLSLERGNDSCFHLAPPGELVGDTSAVAVDLAASTRCTWTIRRMPLAHHHWLVGFKAERPRSFIPAGAVCNTRPKIGPATPVHGDSSRIVSKRPCRDSIFVEPSPRQSAMPLGDLLVDGARKSMHPPLLHLSPASAIPSARVVSTTGAQPLCSAAQRRNARRHPPPRPHHHAVTVFGDVLRLRRHPPVAHLRAATGRKPRLAPSELLQSSPHCRLPPEFQTL